MTDSKAFFYNHIAQTSENPVGLEVERAEGCKIYTTDGTEYTDLISGIAVSSLGHRHPAVVQAVKDQLDRHMHVMVYGEFIQKPQAELAKRLTSALPEKLDRVYFVNSGTEAVEGALKLAKKHTGRTKLVSFHNSYHGDTHGSLSVTGREIYRKPYLPLLPDVLFLEYNNPDQLDRIDSSAAAVIIEPVQGEGGVIPADTEWFKKLRRQCDRHGVQLIFDEIQTGFFRTGSLFAFEQYGVVPDILCMAKAMGGGMPIGGFAASTDLFKAFMNDPPLNHVTTFGGHPVSCAAALATLNVLLDGDFAAKSGRIEQITREELKGKGILELRGRGAMLGLQLESSECAQRTVNYALENNVIIGWTLHSSSLIRIAPPLVIDETLLRNALGIVRDGINRS